MMGVGSGMSLRGCVIRSILCERLGARAALEYVAGMNTDYVSRSVRTANGHEYID
jgi:hypothetical protein